MGLFDIFKRNKVQEQPVEERKINLGGLLYNSSSSFVGNKAMKLSAFYCGVQQISDAVGMLPKNIVKYTNRESVEVNHSLWKVLNLKPNEKDIPFQMWKSAIEHMIIKGNAFMLIERDANLNVVALRPVENDFVTTLPQPNGTIKYSVSGVGTVDAINMLDFAMHRDEMFRGVPLLRYAYNCLEGCANTETAANKFFKGGAGLSGILQAAATLTQEQKSQIRESWNQAFSGEGSNGIAVLPQGLSFSPVSVSPKDAMLIEAREFGVVEIARFLNISPIRLFDLKDVNYNSMESTDLNFVQNTCRPYCEVIRNEINLKLFKPSEVGKVGISFDYSDALQTNKESEINYYRGLLTNALATPNEIRKKLGFSSIPKEDGGDALICQISYGTLSDIYNGKYLKQNAQEQSTQQDNKVSGGKEE